ncbi:thialysine N-epsilon-acetyltransferase-like [Diadema antillarum]|uniref:thialysine N-epsilon-acetyltransferase-like n=1 Tax=Diadema antillarum TaxID=105358 RepID=UPI003A8638D1
MASYVIRRGRLEDVDSLLGLIVKLQADFHRDGQPNITEEALRRDAFSGEEASLRFYVAEVLPTSDEKDAGSVVGFAATHNFYSLWKGRALYLCGLFIEENYRGMSISRKLVYGFQE